MKALWSGLFLPLLLSMALPLFAQTKAGTAATNKLFSQVIDIRAKGDHVDRYSLEAMPDTAYLKPVKKRGISNNWSLSFYKAYLAPFKQNNYGY